MSGHNRWSQIKHKKGLTDAKRSKIFSKFARTIAVESKAAGGNVNSPALKAVIDRAKAVNMPNDNIERAVKKGAGGDASQMEAITYEAYGPGGAALIIDVLTDNRNKAAQEVKHILSKNGCSLAAIGAASWAFTKTADGWEPSIEVELSSADSETITRVIEELEDNDDVQNVYTNAALTE